MKASLFLQEIKNIGIHTITGVPDSTLKQFCDAVRTDDGKTFRHYVTANEGQLLVLPQANILRRRVRVWFIFRIPVWGILLTRLHPLPTGRSMESPCCLSSDGAGAGEKR